jgi:hypothetical protein
LLVQADGGETDEQRLDVVDAVVRGDQRQAGPVEPTCAIRKQPEDVGSDAVFMCERRCSLALELNAAASVQQGR